MQMDVYTYVHTHTVSVNRLTRYCGFLLTCECDSGVKPLVRSRIKTLYSLEGKQYMNLLEFHAFLYSFVRNVRLSQGH